MIDEDDESTAPGPSGAIKKVKNTLPSLLPGNGQEIVVSIVNNERQVFTGKSSYTEAELQVKYILAKPRCGVARSATEIARGCQT